jgi:signal transduction histidine kinase
MPEMRRLTPDVETALFRIIQEGLGNVHRHANASTASVRSAIEGGTIRLEITDDGQGFDSVPSGEGREKYKASVGLLGMRERAEQLGGSMSIESTPGGTEIIVIIPTVIPVDTMDVCDAQNS